MLPYSRQDLAKGNSFAAFWGTAALFSDSDFKVLQGGDY